MHVTVPVRQDGRVVIPYAVREDLGLDYGDLVSIDIRLVAGGVDVDG